MKNPLRYQLSEYDCGPTSMLNGISYLFERSEIPPEIVRNIMLYCLDCFGEDGRSGRRGTSCAAMMFLSNWLNSFGQAGHLPVSSRCLSGKAVNFGQNSLLRDALNRQGAAVVRLDLEGWHYVLITGIQGDLVRLFDPYYMEEPFLDPAVRIVSDHPDAFNRLVPAAHLEQETLKPYALGPQSGREAVLLFNERTKLTEEKTIEYMI
ncbi:MAG: peptidase C39 [Lachnospiraceae bacterium]|nr:peptidase C39 [Lachnospiraceae bacterium]